MSEFTFAKYHISLTKKVKSKILYKRYEEDKKLLLTIIREFNTDHRFLFNQLQVLY